MTSPTGFKAESAEGREDSSSPEHAVARALIEAFPDATLLLGPQKTVLVANGEARRLLDVSFAAGPVSRFLRDPSVMNAISAAEKGTPAMVRYREQARSDRWIEAHVSPLSLEQACVLVVLRDLTEAEQLDRMRADFVANASHELRTPLASLLGFIETLQGPARDDPDARQKFLDIMQVQARRMARLISDLLSLSRIERDEHVRPETNVDLAEITAQVVESLKPMAQEDGVALLLTAPKPVPVMGARDELARAVENLIENAIKYAASGKKVAITTLAEDGEGRKQAVFRVRDFGPGIAPEHLPRLTERFYRVDVGESRAKGGTGLGLAIVKHIVNRHRGHLDIESVPGEGALFTIRLDLAD